jgi:hypothetical protein
MTNFPYKFQPLDEQPAIKRRHHFMFWGAMAMILLGPGLVEYALL